MQRLGAVVAGAHGNAALVQQGADVVRVHILRPQRTPGPPVWRAQPARVMPGMRCKPARPARAKRARARRWRLRPTWSIKRAAAARPTAPATLGVPPSRRAGRRHNRRGRSDPLDHVAAQAQGYRRSSALRRQPSTPVPMGPYILWPEKAIKSQSSAPARAWRMRRPGRRRAPSAPRPARPGQHKSSKGGRSPVALALAVRASTRVRGVSRRCRSATCRRPWASGRRMRSLAPLMRAACCQGTRLAWCSRPLTMISSPGRSQALPGPPAHRPKATRFSASVVPLVKTSSCSAWRRQRFNVAACGLKGVGGALA
jgi:hypothetical protein